MSAVLLQRCALLASAAVAAASLASCAKQPSPQELAAEHGAVVSK